ncbi:hypothetical protein [Agrococcus baldri]|uniref:Methionine synthase II (Cobalamin-independent) n=1 Tax=Agrococcus baldri TaxID=153730 RepID=A0AA87RHH6_9MICO|nr:hypothetical protein [Agrococcus baldri]GEK79583.1 hypothetical protein ABA31_09340 [Agrococcus baldri]
MSAAVPTHLVGSINQPDAESVFRIVADRLDTVPRIPDGEVGERFYWIQFQTIRFDATPGLERVGEPGHRIRDTFDVRPFRVTGEVVLPELGYAAAAIDSYERFAALQERGVIAAGTRFQVSLPTPVAIVGAFIEADSRAAFEPVYREALRAELAAILAAVPHERLAIQWDAAVEFAILERDRRPAFAIEPWWGADALQGVVDRLTEVGGWVPQGVELGYHLCYGDVEEAHFVQPEDAGTLAAVIRGVLGAASRPVDWIHLPVPIERDDEAYFAPLAGIGWGRNQVFLGLVHHEDGVAGALRRAAAARAAVPELAGAAGFGVATECGFGRGPAERTAPLLDVHRDVAAALAAVSVA